MATPFSGWEQIRELGKGGQGTVFLARSPMRAKDRTKAPEQAYTLLHSMTIGGGTHDRTHMERFAIAVSEFSKADAAEHLGALKVFDAQSDSPEKEKAKGRLAQEIQVLQKLGPLNNPGILRLLEACHLNESEWFIVTEFHAGGSLTNHLQRFKGKALDALISFLPLVEAVVAIHSLGAIHRDIKTANILVADDGRLVLSDFGIVFFENASDRLTASRERVGTRDWMAPWAYRNIRVSIESVNAKLDLYPLGKVLWSMVAGEDGFPWFEFDHPDNDLALRFPNDLAMLRINGILQKCVVREERDCLDSAEKLRDLVVEAIAALRLGSSRPNAAPNWSCRICGTGTYSKCPDRGMIRAHGPHQQQNRFYDLYLCTRCGHIEWFVIPEQLDALLRDYNLHTTRRCLEHSAAVPQPSLTLRFKCQSGARLAASRRGLRAVLSQLNTLERRGSVRRSSRSVYDSSSTEYAVPRWPSPRSMNRTCVGRGTSHTA